MREFNQSQSDELILFERSTDECDDVLKTFKDFPVSSGCNTSKSTQQPKNIEMFHRADNQHCIYMTTTTTIKSSSIHSVIRFKFNVDGFFFAAVPNPSSLLFAFKQNTQLECQALDCLFVL